MSNTTVTTKRNGLNAITSWLIQNRIIVLFVAMISVATFSVPYFACSANISSLLTQTAINAILAVGMSFTMMAGGMDLSIGSILFLSGVSYALFQDFGLPIAIAAGIVTGTLAGVLNGVLIKFARVNFFIATLATSIGLRGLGLTLIQGNTLPGHIAGFEWLGNERAIIAGFPIEVPVFVAVAIVILAHFFMTRYQLGRDILAIGGNRDAARLAGIDVERTFFSTFVLSGITGGIGGVLLASRMASASTLVGEESALAVVSAAVLGGVSLTGGTGTISGAILGLIILQIIGNCLNLLTVDAYAQLIVRGFVVIAVVAFDAYYNPREGQAWG